MPRTQVTICGAPKEIAIPKMAAMHQPQEIRFAIAMAPSTMTRMIAMGVSQERILVCSAVAPVMKGEVCASARSGTDTTASSSMAVPRVRRVGEALRRIGTLRSVQIRQSYPNMEQVILHPRYPGDFSPILQIVTG